ncbi:MAG: hypothetical protein ACX939_06560 [Hyphococcus sp.]
MKKYLIALASAGFAIAPAFAGDLESYCVEYTSDNGGDPSGCSCLADAADASMAEELMAVSSEADIEGLSDASKEAIAACWPDAA